MERIHTLGSTDTHLVDNVAYMYSHNHMSVKMDDNIRRATQHEGQTHHKELAFPFNVRCGNARHGSTVAHAEYILGR